MKLRLFARWPVAVAAIIAAPILGAQATQTVPKGSADKESRAWSTPRTVDGQPDLRGVWTNATVTPLERPAEFAGKEFFTPAEAAAWAKRVTDRNNVDKRGNDVEADVAAAYNEAWWDRGTQVTGTLRTSLISDPKDGKLPPMTAEGRARAAAAAEQRRLHLNEGPESRGLGERCLHMTQIGPPMMPGSYNNNYQIFQTKDTVVILIEMLHSARIIPLNDRAHLPSTLRQWMGDSVGHWEGNTLVVDTTNFNDKTRFRGTSEKLHLTERFTRTGPKTILYEFTVDDPSTYARPWTVQMTMSQSDSKVYEYACHEGNYAMTGILSAARAEESAASEKAAK